MKRLCVCVAVLSLAIFATTAQANLLDDGSFENHIGAANSNSQDDSLSDWSLTTDQPNGTDFSGNFTTAPWARTPDDGGSVGIWFKAFGGTTGNTANASLSQSVAAPANGDYLLTFQAAKETFFTAGSATVSLSSSGTGGSDVLDVLAATFNSGGNMNDTANGNPTDFSLSLTGVTAGDTLTVSIDMVDGVDAGENPQSFMVDNFNLNVPEPGAMALAGMGLLGLLSLRRKS